MTFEMIKCGSVTSSTSSPACVFFLLAPFRPPVFIVVCPPPVWQPFPFQQLAVSGVCRQTSHKFNARWRVNTHSAKQTLTQWCCAIWALLCVLGRVALWCQYSVTRVPLLCACLEDLIEIKKVENDCNYKCTGLKVILKVSSWRFSVKSPFLVQVKLFELIRITLETEWRVHGVTPSGSYTQKSLSLPRYNVMFVMF